MYAFAQQGQIRCTDGKLVSTQDQCPSTDTCPPPENNTISNCVPKTSSNSSSETNNSNNQSTTIIPCSNENRLTPLSKCASDSSP